MSIKITTDSNFNVYYYNKNITHSDKTNTKKTTVYVYRR